MGSKGLSTRPVYGTLLLLKALEDAGGLSDCSPEWPEFYLNPSQKATVVTS